MRMRSRELPEAADRGHGRLSISLSLSLSVSSGKLRLRPTQLEVVHVSQVKSCQQPSPSVGEGAPGTGVVQRSVCMDAKESCGKAVAVTKA